MPLLNNSTMSYEDDFINLDFRYWGGSKRQLILRKTPPEYHLFRLSHSNRKAHFVLEDSISSQPQRPWDSAVAICGRRTEGKYAQRFIEANDVCSTCLKKLDGAMGEYLWDEENEEYYHPLK